MTLQRAWIGRAVLGVRAHEDSSSTLESCVVRLPVFAMCPSSESSVTLADFLFVFWVGSCVYQMIIFLAIPV